MCSPTPCCTSQVAHECDRRIVAAASARLRACGYRVLANLQCESRDGVVSIKGVVPSFYLKQVAQALLKGIAEVREVRNLVDVTPHNPQPLSPKG